MSKAVNEEDEEMQLGRVLARASKDTTKKLEKLAKSQGKKKTDIVKEALDLYEKFGNLENLDGRTLMAGLLFWREVMQMNIEMFASISPIFSNALVRNEIAMLQNMMQMMREQQQQQDVQQQEPASEMSDVLQNMRAMLMQKMMETMMNMMGNILPGGGGLLPSSNNAIQQNSEVNDIPVEVRHEE